MLRYIDFHNLGPERFQGLEHAPPGPRGRQVASVGGLAPVGLREGAPDPVGVGVRLRLAIGRRLGLVEKARQNADSRAPRQRRLTGPVDGPHGREIVGHRGQAE